VPINSGLKNQPMVIILHDHKVSIKQSDQPGEHNTGTIVKISPVIGLDDIMDALEGATVISA
jgi:hypothetical protein